ncbi:OB-fold domain-containing protein [Xanthobacter sp. KR7-65]|uniref:Zn-ribbon domain-containing OB-fold protein n=1 Tax=Xanthobacter sp. KR7-65 TaxID=3156612 RepID=UPI0032B395E8
MTDLPSRPVPKTNLYVPSQPFWDGARSGELVLQFCLDTNRFQHPPHPLSLYTGSQNVEWRPVSGKGVVYASTVVRVPGPGVTGRIPLAVATVELDEGVRIIANIIESPFETIQIGSLVELAWDRLDGGVPYPAFRIVSRQGSVDA